MAALSDTALVSILLGSLITIVSTMAAWGLLHFNQRRVDRDRTRRLVLYEVDHIADTVDEVVTQRVDVADDVDADRLEVSLSTDVLDEGLEPVRKLTSPEVGSIYEFYEVARLVSRELGRQRAAGEVDPARLRDLAAEVETRRDAVHRNVRRSRLSLFTEWYKQRDRERRVSRGR